MKTLFKLPRQPYILACSGGPDSMAAFAFLLNGGHDFGVAYFHHGTEHGEEAQKFVANECIKRKVPFFTSFISGIKNKKESPEEYFRRERYTFLASFNKKVITAHHLDDCVETWLFSSIHGNPKLIPYVTTLCIRPFLTCSKEELMDFATRSEMKWVIDPTNIQTDIPRNSIRHELIPLIKKVNPNIRSTIKRKLEDKFKREGLKIF